MTGKAGPRRDRYILAAGVLVGVAATWLLCAAVSRSAAIGYVGGAVTGAGMLGALVFVLNKLSVPPDERPTVRWPYLVLHVAKFALAGAVAWLTIVVMGAGVIAFMGGYTYALVVVLIIFGGQQLSIDRPDPEGTNGAE